MNITVADLDKDLTLDQVAMASVLGGSHWHNHGSPSTTGYGNYRASGWSRWMNAGRFTKKRFRNLYRTKYMKVRQHRTQWQKRSIFSF